MSDNKSIFEELNNIILEHDFPYIIENRAQNVIHSAINLIEEISTYYDNEITDDLQRKLFNSIRTKNPNKFIKTFRRITEDENGE